MHTRLDTPSLRSLIILVLLALFGLAAAEAQPPRRGNGPPDARTKDYRLFQIDTSKLNCGCKSRVEVKVQNIFKNRGSRVPVELKVWQGGVPAKTYRQLWNPRSGVELETLVFDQVEVPCGITNHFKATIDFEDRSDNNDKQTQAQVVRRCPPRPGSGPPAPRTGSGSGITSPVFVKGIQTNSAAIGGCNSYIDLKVFNMGRSIPVEEFVTVKLEIKVPGQATKRYEQKMFGLPTRRDLMRRFAVKIDGEPDDTVTFIGRIEGRGTSRPFKRQTKVARACPGA